MRKPYIHRFASPPPSYSSIVFAIISKDDLKEVQNLPHSLLIWKCLEARFNMASLAKARDLKRLLDNLNKLASNLMEGFLRGSIPLLIH